MVRNTPCRSHRRPEVTTGLLRQSGGLMDFSIFDRAMSSIKAMSGNPPTASNTSRRTNIAWSPVAMPVQRERRFINQAITGKSGCKPSMMTSKRPQAQHPCRCVSTPLRVKAPYGNPRITSLPGMLSVLSWQPRGGSVSRHEWIQTIQMRRKVP